MTRFENRVPAGETASSKSPRWEHKLEVVKRQQEAQGVRWGERGHRLGSKQGQDQTRPCPSILKVWSKDQQHQHHLRVC